MWWSNIREIVHPNNVYIHILENSPKKAWALIGKKSCLYNTELACAVDVVRAQAKRIYILIIKVNKLSSFFLLRCFLKEIENMYCTPCFYGVTD